MLIGYKKIMGKNKTKTKIESMTNVLRKGGEVEKFRLRNGKHQRVDARKR